MIDLSFLTEEEHETILRVLQRDAQLKMAEEKRIKSLQRSVKDRGLLKYLSGEWFYERKLLRHRDRIHGCDIIRASIRHKHKPVTLLELSQMIPEKPSFVASVNQEVYIPPELCGLIPEDPQNRRNENWISFGSSKETPKSNIQSPTKLRKNPFNQEAPAHTKPPEVTRDPASTNNEQAVDKPLDPTPARHEEPLSSAEFPLSHSTNPNQEPLECIPEEDTNTSSPFPLYRRTSLFYLSQDGASQAHYPTPRGILKVMSDQGSTDSLVNTGAVPQSSPDRSSAAEDAAPTGRDALGKQVRFGPAVGQGEPQLGEMEPREHSLLDVDHVVGSLSAEDNNDGGTAGVCRPLLRQVAVGSQEIPVVMPEVSAHQVPGDLSEQYHDQFPQVSKPLSTEQESGKASYLENGTEEDAHSQAKAREWFKMHAGDNVTSQPAVDAASDIMLNTILPIPRSRLLRTFSKAEAKDNNTKEEDSLEEIADDSIKPRISSTSADSVPLDNQINPDWIDEEVKSPVPKEVISLQPTALQNTAFKDSDASSLDTGSDPQQEPTESEEDVAQKLSNLKAFWEKENSGPKVIFTREQAMTDGNKKISAEDITHDNAGSITELTQHHGTAQSHDETFFQENESGNDLFDLPKEDGTYHAHPILINDETDDSLAGSVKDFQESSPSGPEMCSPLLPEDKPTTITDLKGYWEKDYTTPKIIVAKVTEASSGADHSSPDKSEDLISQVCLSQLDLNEEVENPNNIASAKPMIGKGFVNKSLGKSQLRKLSQESESSERPLSPILSQSSRSRDSSDDELRRSPSKACHPKILVRESSLPRGSAVDGSPLKTFPIDIALEPKDNKEEGERPTPAPRQRTDPSHEAKATVSISIPSEDIISRSLPLSPEDSEKQTPPGTPNPLARSFVPDDYQHYLGSPEKAHRPPFEEEEKNLSSPVSVGDVKSKARRPLKRQGATYGKAMIEGNHSRIRSWIAQNAGSSSHEDKTTSAQSEFRASSGSYDEGDSSPVGSASKQRQLSMSQSMENLGARTEEDKGQGSSLGQLNLSMDDVGAAVPPASLHPDPLQVRRMSKSVPALQLEETEDDEDDDSFGTKPRRRTTSVVSNLSLSSGLASMSSVSGSMTSISNGDFGDIEVQGTMQFALNYVQKLGELQIFVVQCKDLALAEPKKSRSDPYVKCYLVPDKTKLGKRKTTVKKRTLNPSYNEILRFKILMEVLRMQNLNISVWHNDTFGRNSFLGEISLDLSEWDFANTQINDYALTPRPLTQFPSPLAVRSKPTNKTGQMRVALRYLPQPSHGKKTSKMEPGEVQIWVKDCKDLPPARGVIIDPFVKCTVLPDTSKKSRQKTRVVKRTANPMFNHTMVYDGFRPEDLREACAEITVWDHDRLNNHYIGGLRLGLGTGKSYGGEVDWMDSSEPETNLWEKMMGSEGEWVEDILPLRTFVVAKSRAK
ncbi:synaptotagmin-like protein 2 isoform X1 [Gadus morhua]|uniref:Synaptotagmin-like protein 2 n=3 Tax=Gadus morhua TaxID=8049 RepID=A0A8C5C6S2_GADMO|nr:synaptotagmin-like protein 2 isoform X1 [Gadus morhua]